LHGGPFANIAHGCNSVIATEAALKLADYVVTEAGFGADLGAEKFINIKCRKAGLEPSAAVVVATLRALKFHGGCDLKHINEKNFDALGRGVANLERHLRNIRDVFGIACMVAVNHFGFDTQEEYDYLCERLHSLSVPVVRAEHWAHGGAGAEALALKVVELTGQTGRFKFLYEDELPLLEKLRLVATTIYGAKDIAMDAKVLARIEEFQAAGFGHYPVCIAKTPYSFSSDASLRGAPSGHTLTISAVHLRAGAEFVVAVCGDIWTMPGLPKSPAAHRMDIDDSGRVTGLF